MNVSLTPELASAVNERVERGFYSSASEVVREALRLLIESNQGPHPAKDLSGPEWRELRAALLVGEDQLLSQRTSEVADLFRAGLEIARSRIQAEHVGASLAEIQKHLAQWLRERAGAEFGDGPGTPVSAERIEAILNG